VLFWSAFLLLCSAAASAQQRAIELWLALDASGSMYAVPIGIKPEPMPTPESESVLHYEVQRMGHITALADPDVRALLVSADITVHILFWAGAGSAIEATPPEGVVVNSLEDVRALQDILLANTPERALANSSTDHHAAIRYIASKVRTGYTLIVDISTDEGISEGVQSVTRTARDQVMAMGGVINAIAIGSATSAVALSTLTENLVTETGFVAIGTPDGYAKALRDKLYRELMLAMSLSR